MRSIRYFNGLKNLVAFLPVNNITDGQGSKQYGKEQN